jgi:hypothetical protein
MFLGEFVVLREDTGRLPHVLGVESQRVIRSRDVGDPTIK